MRSLPAVILGFLLAASLARSQAPSTPAATSQWLETLVTQAAQAGKTSVTIPPGSYRLAPLHKMAHLQWTGLKNLTIVATGVELILTEPTVGGIEFDNCSQVSLQGAHLRHDPLPFTQGRLEKISPDRLTVQIRLDHGYPANLDDHARFYVKGRLWFYLFAGTTRQWRPQTHDAPVKNAKKLGEGFFELSLPTPLYPAAQEGDGVAFRGRSGTDIHLAHCAGMRLEDVEIANGGGFCFHESDGGGGVDGGSYYRVRVTYGPPPTPDAPAPIIACNADAFHSSNMRHGPTLEKCLFEGMCDDGIAIHGTYARLLNIDGGKAIANRLLNARPGDVVRVLDAHARLIAETKLVSWAPAKDFQAPAGFDEKNVGPFFAIELRDPLPKDAFVVSDLRACGGSFAIRDCTIRNHRARGMLIKTGNGIIENNLVDGSTKGGIVLSPEYNWREACYSWGVVIRHNTIRHVGTAWQPNEPMAGAISIGAYEGGAYADTLGHRNITVEDNTIEDTASPNLLISSATGVSVTGNRFVRPLPSTAGRLAQIAGGTSLIVIAGGEKISFKDNTISDPAPGLQPPWIKALNVHASELTAPTLTK